jgi:hypothetical protein
MTLFHQETSIVKILKLGVLVQKGQIGIIPSLHRPHFFL